MALQKSLSVVSEDDIAEDFMLGFCQMCGKSIRLENQIQRFCSNSCKNDYQTQMKSVRKRKRNSYQKRFRRLKYRTEVRHIQRVICPKCEQTGYLVRYIVKNKETDNIVSSYETVRHQVTERGKSILKGQCYIRSLPKGSQILESEGIREQQEDSANMSDPFEDESTDHRYQISVGTQG